MKITVLLQALNLILYNNSSIEFINSNYQQYLLSQQY